MNKLSQTLREYFKNQEQNGKVKTSFWATDCEKSSWELYHKCIGTPETNTMTAEKRIELGARTMIEHSLVSVAKEAGIKIIEKEEGQNRIDMKYKDIDISGKIDMLLEDNTPVEIKTFYGDFQTNQLQNMRPRTSYLKQLSVYMEALQSKDGILLYIDFTLGNMYEFHLISLGDRKYKCNLTDIEFDLTKEFERWNKLYNENILPKIEPDLDIFYKYDVSTLDWSKVSKTNIQKARNNMKVIGDWQAIYSPYLNLIIQKQDTIRGYTDEELKIIKEKTAGYSTK